MWIFINWIVLKQVTSAQQLWGEIDKMCLHSSFCLSKEHVWAPSKKYLRRHLGASCSVFISLYLSQFNITQTSNHRLGLWSQIWMQYSKEIPVNQPHSPVNEAAASLHDLQENSVWGMQYFPQRILQKSENPWKLLNHLLTDISSAKEVKIWFPDSRWNSLFQE